MKYGLLAETDPSAPAGSVAGDVPGPSPEPPAGREASPLGSVAPAPATFLGIAVTLPGASPRATSPGGSQEPPGPAATWLVTRRKAIAIGSAAAIALLAAVVVIAWRRGAPASDGTGVTSGSVMASGSADRPDPGGEVVARANDLFVQGDKDAALDLLARSRRQYPASAILPFTAGRIYFSKFYWTEGLKSFRDAIRIDPAYRADPELIKTVLRGFLTTPTYHSDLASFLREEIGSAAQPFLEETARDHPNAMVRSRAAGELHRYR